MKTFFKTIVAVISLMVLIAIAQEIFSFNLVNFLKNLLGGTSYTGTRTTVGQEYVIPKFEIVSLELFYPQNLAVIEADKFEWWRLNIGTVFIFVQYDTYLRLGVRNPDQIKRKRIGDIVYVDESTIVIELLDAKLNNYEYIKTFKSNPLVINNSAEEFIFRAMNDMEKELINKIVENGQANFETAKKNFKENYINQCRALGLEVVWR